MLQASKIWTLRTLNLQTLTDHVFRIPIRRFAKAQLTTREGGWLRDVENAMGSLPQPLWPGQGTGEQTSPSTHLVFLSRDRHHCQESRPHRWAVMKHPTNCVCHSTAHGWTHSGEAHVSPASTATWGKLQRFPRKLAGVSQDVQLLLRWVQQEKYARSDYWGPPRCGHHRTAPQGKGPHTW